MKRVRVIGLVGGLVGRMIIRAACEGVIQRFAIDQAVSAHPSRVDGKPRGKGKRTKDWQR